MTTTRLLLVLLALALPGALLSACGSEDSSDGAKTATPTPGSGASAIQRDEANAKVSFTIGSKNFTEQRVLGEIYAQGLRAAGYDVQTKLDLGDEHVALKALKSKEIDAYPEYTGTALQSFFGVEPEDLPKDPARAYKEVEKDFAEIGMVAFPPTPFTSSNEVAVTKETATRLDLQKISDLSGEASELTLAGSPECRERFDCLRGLERSTSSSSAVSWRSRSLSATRYSPLGKRTYRSCSRRIRRSSGSPRCCWRMIGACSARRTRAWSCVRRSPTGQGATCRARLRRSRPS